MSQEHLGLFDTPPDRQEIRFSIVIVGLLLAALLLILPVRDIRLRELGAFVPMIDAAMFLGELITATLLYSQAAIFRSPALIVLGTAYVYTALLLVPHALTFPGAFAPEGLLGAGISSTAWIALARRAVFPIAVILYVHLKRADVAARPGPERPTMWIVVALLAAVALAAAVTILATSGHDLLPPFYSSRSHPIHTYAVAYECVVFALLLVATTLLFRNCNSVLDLWLLVAFACWLIESLLILTVKSRFTAGWYWLYGMTLFSHLVVMLALIAESNRLYARLVLSTSRRNREREARLLSIDAVAAAISHEVGQPLASLSLHASACLNLLTRPRPDVKMAIKALRATVEAGSRTADVIKSIRAMFAERPGATVEFSLNDLVRATIGLMRKELAAEKISLQLTLDEALPPILADRVQIQRVLVNLLSNAIEALGATRGRPRRIAIRSTPLDGDDVLLEVNDNGVGISSEAMPHLFESFFTTKASGTGLGLALSRTIVEAHGGHLWASQGEAYGATFHLQLPQRLAEAAPTPGDRSPRSIVTALGRSRASMLAPQDVPRARPRIREG